MTRFALLAVGIAVAAGCAASPGGAMGYAWEQSFPLRVGESAILAATGLEIAFEAVTSDSRCGKGEVCVWEGDAIVRLRLQAAGGVPVMRDLHTASGQPGATDYEGHTIRLVDLHPAAFSGRSIAQADYVATLHVTPGSPDREALQ
jgi:hypothetical protein